MNIEEFFVLIYNVQGKSCGCMILVNFYVLSYRAAN